MARKQNTMFPGDTILLSTFKHLGVLASGAYIGMIGIVSDYLEICGLGLPAKFLSGLLLKVNSISSVVLTKDNCVLSIAGGGSTVTLPVGVEGTTYVISNAPGITLNTIVPNGADTINGAASLALDNSGDSVILVFDGASADWHIVADNRSVPATTPQWVKVNKTFTDFSDPSGTKSITAYALPAGGVIHAAKVKQSAAFTGGGASAVTISLGVSGDESRFLPGFDVFPAPGNTVFAISGTVDSIDQATPVNILATAVETGGNLEDLTTGAVDIWLLVSVAV